MSATPSTAPVNSGSSLNRGMPYLASNSTSTPISGSSSARDAVALYLVNKPDTDYEKDLELIKTFLREFKVEVSDNHTAGSFLLDNSEESGRKSDHFKYREILDKIANLECSSITVELDDLKSMMQELDTNNVNLIQKIERNAHAYLEIFCRAVDSILPSPDSITARRNDACSMFLAHRISRLEVNATSVPGGPVGNSNPRDYFPPALLRNYDLYIKPTTASEGVKMKSVREIRAEDMGKLVKVRGIVTRISEVSPRLLVNTYTCDKCNSEIFEEITGNTFLPKPECTSEECKRNNSKGKLTMQTRGSKFIKFQEFKLQEMADQVPMGHTPRTLTCHLQGDICRSVTAGDVVTISAIFLPKPYTGFQGMKAGLLTDTYLQVMHINQLRQSYQSVEWTEDYVTEIERLSHEQNIYEKLAKSIAPEIYGHLDVKKALLLLMVGGVTKELDDGMKIRGDINICLMGDPGTAKSQLLRYISKVAPRGVYTTGKGSSGVGLTAAVVKDPVTSTLVLEGGALVLADNGICCIDEFDKMEDSDRTAIHEVMEQQTISISKAGISTSLNARTSILAAANPVHSRYNVKKSVKDNINLPYALLSRFDILFLILDKASMDDDMRLAMHVTHVHRTNRAPIEGASKKKEKARAGSKASTSAVIDPSAFIDQKILKLYIARARSFSPVIPENLVDSIASTYVGMRAMSNFEADRGDGRYHTGPSQYTTARTLLAVIRLSQALAKVRFSNLVSQSDVDEALRLMDSAQSSLHQGREDGPLVNNAFAANDNNNGAAAANASTTKIYTLIRDWNQRSFEIPELLMRLKALGYTEEQFDAAIKTMTDSNVWQVSEAEQKLYIL